MADFYLKSGSATEVARSTVYALGNKVVIARADVSAEYLVVRKWVMECTTAGTSGAAVPTWPATVTQDTTTVTDGTVVWTFRKPGFSSGTTANWAFSAIYLDYVASAIAAGDTLYVSNNHTESVAESITMMQAGTIATPSKVVCGTDTAAPPTSVATTGTITTTDTSSYSINGAAYIYGLTLNVGTGTGNPSMVLNNSAAYANSKQIYEWCNFKLIATGFTCRVSINSNVSGNNLTNVTEWRNCGVSFGHGFHGLANFGHFLWNGGSVLAGSTALTSTLSRGNVSPGRLSDTRISGVNLENMGAGCSIFSAGSSPAYGMLRDCKLPAAWTGALVQGTLTIGERYEMYNCDNADTNYRLWIQDYAGTIFHETTIVRTGGASDGTTTLAWRMVTSANANYPTTQLISGEIYSEWVEVVGVPKTITIEILHDSLTALNNDEVWLEVLHLGTLNFPLGVFANNSKASFLASGAAQTASTVAWTTTGLTNPNKQKLSVTFTPQEKGPVICIVKLAKASYTLYVDPIAGLS